MKVVAFDLDRILIDTAPGLHAAANLMLEEFDTKPLSLRTVTGFVGNGVPKLVERFLQEAGLAGRNLDLVLSLFSGVYGSDHVLEPIPTKEYVTCWKI